MSGEAYLTLMSALPHLGDLFTAKESPCSGYKLATRLKMLSQEDAELLSEIENLLQWSHNPITLRDAEILSRAKKLLPRLQEKSELLAETVDNRLEQRTVLAAMRRRQRGDIAPPTDSLWGYGRWLKHIARYWNEPTFRLEGVYPWLSEAEQLLREDATVELDHLLLRSKWEYLGYIGEGHYFDFEAVVIYVLRWNIINRWTGYSGKAAAVRFTNLVADGFMGLPK
ncbi:hypothetical protein [Candidatus Venteria ishoeyi]|uniref:V-type ATP synthase subunit C n=1 Tax=Candidatus Venteria ishoeyi TaxID=1899563 RepID=A0A1H6F6D3_9GAMM|nr:hypothetical protein [Candidatus Venteria ishoeyi]MDM8547522.1 hypothetical protein [Candidatus Venteria ishoeyi]SEH05672.1 Uncharacterised protein [Candidatus Venteria ishoeyi]